MEGIVTEHGNTENTSIRKVRKDNKFIVLYIESSNPVLVI